MAAQRLYARRAYDGKRPGLYASMFRSEPGRQNGLSWPARRGQPRSPLGELMTAPPQEAAVSRRKCATPFHGYYFRILDRAGKRGARRGRRDYLVNGALSGGFALVAWPAQYDATGVMTFIVSDDGVVFEKDLGEETPANTRALTRYDPDSTWRKVQAEAGDKP